MLCIECRNAELETKCSEVAGEVHGELFRVECTALVCPKCNYTTVGGDQIQEFMRILADAYRVKHGFDPSYKQQK